MDTRVTLIFFMCLSCTGIIIGAILGIYDRVTPIAMGIFISSTILFGVCVGAYVRICMAEDRQRIVDMVLREEL